MSVSLSFACLSYDRILPLANRRVLPEGIHLNYLSLEVEEIFWRQLRSQEFDISGEESYYRKTGIFPIMHVIIFKKDIYQKNPWIAMSLYKAFCKLMGVATESYPKTEALRMTLPWIHDEVDRTRSLIGEDWQSYNKSKYQKMTRCWKHFCGITMSTAVQRN